MSATPEVNEISDDLKKRAELAIYLLRNGGEEDPVIGDVGPEDDGPYDLELCMADCHVATIHPSMGDTDFALAECIRDSGKLIQDLLESRDAALSEAAAHKAEVERLLLALAGIATYGEKYTGHGYTCAQMARVAALAATPSQKAETP